MFSPDENKPQGNIDWLEKYGLELEDKVSCDTLNCERPATYYLQVRCCGAVIIGCQHCLHAVFKQVVSRINSGHMVTCQSCKVTRDPSNWLTRPQAI